MVTGYQIVRKYGNPIKIYGNFSPPVFFVANLLCNEKSDLFFVSFYLLCKSTLDVSALSSPFLLFHLIIVLRDTIVNFFHPYIHHHHFPEEGS